MLDPREKTQGDKHSLQFECKQCNSIQRTGEGDEHDYCVYRTDYTAKAEKLQVDPECISDPTLSRRRDVLCPFCEHQEAVSYTQVTKEKLNLIFVCTGCKKYWLRGEGAKDEAEVFSDDSAQ